MKSQRHVTDMNDAHAQAGQRLGMVAFSYMGKLIECKRVNDRTQASLVSIMFEVRKPLKVLVQLHRVPNRLPRGGPLSYSY